MNFTLAFERLLKHEGGYSDHMYDPGGKTMFGITEAVARANGYMGDMHLLPLNTAKAIYKRAYWDMCRCDDLPDSSRFLVFDGAVNSGVSQSTKWLQRALGVSPDGVIGPITLAAANQSASVLPQKLCGQRLQFMTELNTWQDFGKGWARRIATNLMEA